MTKKGEKILVDDELRELLESFTWHITIDGYASTTVGNKKIFMHRMIVNAGKGDVVDHKNRNKIDNRRSNLRKVCASKNNQNSASSRGYRNVHFIGVFFESGKYKVQIKNNRKTLYLGRYDNAIDAAKVYDKKALELYGEDALTNLKLFKDICEMLAS